MRKLMKFLLSVFFCWYILSIALIFHVAENLLNEGAVDDNLGTEVLFRWLSWLTFADTNI